MARDPQDIYDDWYEKQEERLDDLVDSIHDLDDPKKKLKTYDQAIAKAESLVQECLQRDKEPGVDIFYADEAWGNLDRIVEWKRLYVAHEYDQDLADWQEAMELEKEEAAEQKRIKAIKPLILAELSGGQTVTIVELEKKHVKHQELIRRAINELINEGLLEGLKVKNRLAVKLKSDAAVRHADVSKIKPKTEKPKASSQKQVRNDEAVIEFDHEVETAIDREHIKPSSFSVYAAKEKSLSGSEKKPEGKGPALMMAVVIALVVYFVFL